MNSNKLFYSAPERIILLSFLSTIVIGTVLLSLPCSRFEPMSFLDLLFTATSATCVTGLFTIPLQQFTTIGHSIILCLMQIGGLGLITLTLFLMSLFINLGFATQLIAGHILDIDTWKNVKKVLFFIMGLTIVLELLGTIGIFFSLTSGEYSTSYTLFLAFFHAVSSFCNAGISLFSPDIAHHVFADNYWLIAITGILVFCGSFGFITWLELLQCLVSWKTKKRHSLSLLTKMILMGNASLISIPAFLIWILERNNTFAHMSLLESFAHALFNSISVRSAGFLTVPIHNIALSTLMLMMILAFVGASPGSTGSGVRITTFIICLNLIKTVFWGYGAVNIQGRRISKDQLYKAVVIVLLTIMAFAIILFLLLITERAISFFDIVLETISALTNVGLSTGATTALTKSGKWFIIVSMIVGRIGALTLILAGRKHRLAIRLDATEALYPEERVMLN